MLVYLISLPRLRTLKFFLLIILIIAFIHTMKSVSNMDNEDNIDDNLFILDQRVIDLVMNNNCFVPVSLKKVDWHDYKFIEYELQRSGIGEQGNAADLPREEQPLADAMNQIYGLNSMISDEISVNRSLPDLRHRKCETKLYVESLPSVSVIIPFHDEHPKTLLRTVFSVINRSPEVLIKEIILVDDSSTIRELHNIEQNITNYSSKVKLLKAKEYKGLIKAKLIGATEATADVLVFLESHSEVNVNWLPPLLEPIAINYRTVVCPVIDIIDNYTFEYKSENEYHRGGFSWDLSYVRLPIFLTDKEALPEPFENSVMRGGHFAISRIFFWELGGYDPGFYMSGGEQFELSFKIWQCGGRMLTAPCSHVGHVNCSPIFLTYGYDDIITINYRRIAEVWMDEFAWYIYNRNPAYLNIDEDVSEQKALRLKLQCKPFKWFLSEVASDILVYYPPVELNYTAKGQIRTKQVSEQIYCVQADYDNHLLFLNYCYGSKILNQEFLFTWHKEIQTAENDLCWDLPDSKLTMSPVLLNKCHGSGGNQQWRYNVKKKQIMQGDENCLDWDVHSRELYIRPCDNTCITQQWKTDIAHAKLVQLWNGSPNASFDIISNSSIYYNY